MDIFAVPEGANALLLEQLTFHRDTRLRPGLEGLTDDEYLWEPVPGCWSVRPRAEVTAPLSAGAGDLVVEFAVPEPVPAPVTTIAWRLVHLVVGVFGMRNADHFDGPRIGYDRYEIPGTARGPLADLDGAHDRWVGGVRRLGDEGLDRRVGEAERPFASHPYSALVLHIHREVIHHGAEILLLRDLYRHWPPDRADGRISPDGRGRWSGGGPRPAR